MTAAVSQPSEIPAPPDAARPTARGRRGGTVVLALAVALTGLVLGLASADWATGRGFPVGAVRVGPWTAWPRAGAVSADPYTRAVLARTGSLPLGVGEGLAFEAAEDSEGRPLSAQCIYEIGRAVPQSRAWTLSAYGDGRPSTDPLRRSGFTSSEVLRGQDGSFLIALSPDPQPGNWLPAPHSGSVRLILRLYETPVVSVSGTVETRALPSIDRKSCGS